MSDPEEKPEPIFLKKWLMINAALNDKSLSKGDVSVQWQILDRYSVKNGDCWPSLKRLAADTGLTQRTIQRSVTRLTEAGHSGIVKHGNRVESNHYKPNFNLLDRVETSTSLPSNEVETAKTVCRDSQVPKVETPTSLKPSNEPEHKARDSLRGLDNKLSSDAALASPLLGSPLSSKEKFKYPKFWDVYPTRKNVGKTEDEITIKLNDGVLLADIVEGARLYAINLESKRASWKGDKDYTIHPQNFVKDSRWLDDWAVAPKSKEVKPKVKPIDNLQYKEAYAEALNAFYNHIDSAYYDSIGQGSVDSCKGSCQEHYEIDYEQYPNKFLFDFCAVGKPLYYEYMRLEILYRGLESTGDATMEELIKANHLMRERGSDWRAANPDDESLDGCGGDKEWLKLCDAEEEMELNAYHLFK